MRIHAEHAAQARAQRRPAEKVSALGGRADTGAPARHRLPAFANLQEALLENMIQNILVEASRGEVVLTSRPRVIALPPLSLPRWGRPGHADDAGGARGAAWACRLSPKPRLHPYLGLSVFQGSDSRPAAGGAPGAAASGGAPPDGAAPYRLFADLRAQPLRLPALGSARPSLHLPASKSSSLFVISALTLFPQRGWNSRALSEGQMVEEAEVTAATHWSFRGWEVVPLGFTPQLVWRSRCSLPESGLASGGRCERGLAGLCPSVAWWTGTQCQAWSAQQVATPPLSLLRRGAPTASLFFQHLLSSLDSAKKLGRKGNRGTSPRAKI